VLTGCGRKTAHSCRNNQHFANWRKGTAGQREKCSGGTKRKMQGWLMGGWEKIYRLL